MLSIYPVIVSTSVECDNLRTKGSLQQKSKFTIKVLKYAFNNRETVLKDVKFFNSMIKNYYSESMLEKYIHSTTVTL